MRLVIGEKLGESYYHRLVAKVSNKALVFKYKCEVPSEKSGLQERYKALISIFAGRYLEVI